MKHSISIIDDNKFTMSIIDSILGDDYEIIKITTPINIIEDDELSCILVHLSPFDERWNSQCLVTLSRLFQGQIPIIAYTEAHSDLVEKAIMTFKLPSIIYMPLNPVILKNTVASIIELYTYRRYLEAELEARTADLRESRTKLEHNMEFVINALGNVVEFRSLESGDHVKRVSKFTEVLLTQYLKDCNTYSISQEQIKMISNAATIHDLGKIAIPDAILNKPGKLTEEEFNIMKMHTIYGCQILEQFKQTDTEFYDYCYDICRWHHERYDGKGYPDHLIGDVIPIWSQIVAVADVLDALISKRVYKDAYDVDESFEMIQRGDCGTFSPKIMESLMNCKPQLVQVINDLKNANK